MSEKRFMEIEQRVTVDFDSESYYLDGEYWTSWSHYGEEMADAINILLNEQEAEIKKLKEMVQELYELDSKRSLYILQVMQKFARRYSQDSKEYDLLYRLGGELPINPNILWPKEAFTEEELMEDD